MLNLSTLSCEYRTSPNMDTSTTNQRPGTSAKVLWHIKFDQRAEQVGTDT